jgi:hypothetical protein
MVKNFLPGGAGFILGCYLILIGYYQNPVAKVRLHRPQTPKDILCALSLTLRKRVGGPREYDDC